jgi:hypothetical protein
MVALFEGWSDLRYTYQSIALLAGCLGFVLPLAWDSWRVLRPVPPAPAAPEAPPPADAPAT